MTSEVERILLVEDSQRDIDLSGLDVLTQIKRDPELWMIPMVMLTSSREETDLSNSDLRGANAYMVKPVGYSRFAAAIRALGAFWAKVDEPPRRTIGRQRSSHA